MNEEMRKQMREYRTEHPKCFFCIWCKYIAPPAPLAGDWFECELKEKTINHPMWRTLCKEYRVKS